MNRKLAIGLLVCANVLWGSSYAIAKVALEELPPPLLGALRFSLATGLIWLVLLLRSRGVNGRAAVLERVERSDKLRLVALGMGGIAFSYLFSYWGVNLTTATDSALMIIGEVIFTALLAARLAGERLGRWKGMGIVAGIAGVVVLVLGHLEGDGSGDGAARALGNLLILVGLFIESIYSVLGAGLSRKYRPMTVLAFAYTGSLLVWAPLLAWYVAAGQFPALSLAATAGVIYVAVVSSFICYLVWFSVLRATGAGLGAISLFTQPLVGVLLGLFVLGDRLTPQLAAGGALIFAALYLATIPDRAPAPVEELLPGAPVAE